MTHVSATLGAPPDRQEEISYTDLRVIGSGSFGVVYQARLIEPNDSVAIKKVLQDKRFKVRGEGCVCVWGGGGVGACSGRGCAVGGCAEWEGVWSGRVCGVVCVWSGRVCGVGGCAEWEGVWSGRVCGVVCVWSGRVC